MVKRPLLITIFGWSLIVYGIVLGLWFLWISTIIAGFGESIGTIISSALFYKLTFSYTIDPIIMLISGIGFLKGKNWTRFLYIVWVIISPIFLFFNTELFNGNLIGLFKFFAFFKVVLILLLIQRKANLYFTGKPNFL